MNNKKFFDGEYKEEIFHEFMYNLHNSSIYCNHIIELENIKNNIEEVYFYDEFKDKREFFEKELDFIYYALEYYREKIMNCEKVLKSINITEEDYIILINYLFADETDNEKICVEFGFADIFEMQMHIEYKITEYIFNFKKYGNIILDVTSILKQF